MLASITPLGERGRQRRWGSTVAAYVFGSTLGGAAAGVLAGGAGSLAVGGIGWDLRIALVAVALAVGLVVEFALGRVPGPRRQVDESWLDLYRGPVYGFGFGVQLGAGVVTVVLTSTVYVVLVAAFASGSLAVGAAIGALAGLLRGATLLAAARVRTADQLMRLHARMEVWQRPVRTGALAAQLALVALVGVAI
jgi:hypothetical protein